MELADVLRQLDLTDEHGTKVGTVLDLVEALVAFYDVQRKAGNPDQRIDDLVAASCL